MREVDLVQDTPQTSGAALRAARPPPPPPPKTVGAYSVLRQLGAGGMGVVYLARDAVLGRLVAVKLLLPHLFKDPTHTEQFLIEARIVASFGHPNIVTVYSAGADDGHVYLAMEYVEGKTLRERLLEEPLRMAETQRICLSVASALQEAHSRDVVHGDLKPENVIIGRGGRPYVVDFGLARMASQARGRATGIGDATGHLAPHAEAPAAVSPRRAAEAGSAPTMNVQNGSGSGDEGSSARERIIGTPMYMAPEQWRSEPDGTAIDMWALGVMMYELLSGKHPLSGCSSLKEIVVRATSAEELPRLDTRLDLPAELAGAVSACLAKDPRDRLSAGELVDVLTGLVHTPSGVASLKERPFRGLDAFSERHARFFFGRSEEVESFLERIRSHPVLPVIGASGVGKSSFVQAGVIPRLRELEEWSVIRLRPGKDPFSALAQSLSSPLTLSTTGTFKAKAGMAQDGAQPVSQPQAVLAAELFEQPKRLALLLATLAKAERASVLLSVDQMEEVVTMVADPAVRNRFVDAVCGAADDRQGPVRVVFTARDDFLSRLAETPSMRRALESVTVLQAPGREALHEIMTLPLRTIGYDYDDPELATDMVEAVGGEPAALPLLQFTAALLWERRDENARLLRRSEYAALGGVQGALASHAEGVLKNLDVGDIEIVRRVFLRLVAADGTRRTVEQQEMVETLGPRAAAVLKLLSDARLLAVRSEDDLVHFELSHESLVHTWGLLRRWLDEGREEAAFIDEMGQAATLWAQRGRRRTETWTGDALTTALRKIDRYQLHLGSTTGAFIDACKKSERSRVLRRKGLFAGAFALVALVAVVSTVKEREADAQRTIANLERAQGDAEAARSALLAGNPLEARARLRRSVETSDSPLARALWRRLSYEPLLWQTELGGTVTAVAIAAEAGRVVAAEYSGLVSVFDVSTGAARVRLRGQDGSIQAVGISSDARYVVYGNAHGEVGLWDLSSMTALRERRHEGPVRRVQFSPTGQEVVSTGADGRALVWRVSTWQARQLGDTGSAAKGLAFGPGGEVAIGRVDGSVQLWRSSTAASPRTLQLSKKGIEVLALSATGVLAAGFKDGAVILLDAESGETTLELAGHTAFITGLAFNSGGDRLYSSAFDQRLLAWDTATGARLSSFDGHQAGIWSLAMGAQGRRLVSGGNDRSLRLWNASLLTRRAGSFGHEGPVAGVAVTSNGKWLVSGGADAMVRVWELASGKQVAEGRGHGDTAVRVAVSPDGRRAASASLDGTARVWSLPGAQQERVLVGHQGSVYAVAFIENDRVLTAGWDGTVRLWRVEDGFCERVLTLGEPALAVAASPNGELILASGLNGAVRLWRKPFSAPASVRDFGPNRTNDLTFASDGRTAAAASWGAVAVWDDITQPRPARVLEPLGNAVGVALSPGGNEVAAGFISGRLTLWRLDTGESSDFHGHWGEVSDVAFSPDGSLLATAGDDNTVRTWQAADAMPLWRTKVLLGPPLDGALTHEGWTRNATGAENARWRDAVANAPTIARQAGQTMCATMPSGGVQLWDLAGDAVVAEMPKLQARTLRAVGRGCVVVDESARGWLLTAGAEAKALAEGVVAVGAQAGQLLVATDSQILALGPDGTVLRSAGVSVGVTAVAAVGAQVALGYSEGSIDLRAWDSGKAKPLRDTGSTRVTFLAEGPRGTLMAGYGDGLFGLWLPETGKRLLSEKLHGPIVEVREVDSVVRVASALGEIRNIDLGALDLTHCGLLSQVWRSVSVTWEQDTAVVRPPTGTADCDLYGSRDGGPSF